MPAFLCILTSLHCCILLYLPYFHIRMESLLAWRCSSPKRPSAMQRPALPFSMTSSSTKLPTMENLPLTAPTLTPLLIQCLNHPKPLRHPNHPRRQSHPNTPRNNHLAVIPHLVATHHPAVALNLGAILPPLAIHPPTTPPPSTNARPPPHPPRLSYAGPEVGRRHPSQSAQRLAESTREDTSIHLPPRLTSPSRLHHHPG